MAVMPCGRDEMAVYLRVLADLAQAGAMDGCVVVFKGSDGLTHTYQCEPSTYPDQMIGHLFTTATYLAGRISHYAEINKAPLVEPQKSGEVVDLVRVQAQRARAEIMRGTDG